MIGDVSLASAYNGGERRFASNQGELTAFCSRSRCHIDGVTELGKYLSNSYGWSSGRWIEEQ